MPLGKHDIVRLCRHLNDELTVEAVIGELYLVGGAVMCLVFEARQSTKDVDAFFKPASVIRAAARKVAVSEDYPENWLNDAVKRYLSEKGDFEPYLELSNLRILTATPEYLLAMKCLAMRLGEEFHDEQDVRFLLRYLNLTSYDDALAIVSRYYPLDRFPQKTLYALEEILHNSFPS